MINSIENYEMKEQTISIVKANIFAGIVAIGIITVSVVLFCYLWTDKFSFELLEKEIVSVRTVFIYIGVIISFGVHEFLHAFFWKIYCVHKWKSVKIGFDKKNLTPYCHCDEIIKVWQYIVGVAAPLIFLGIIPFVIAIWKQDIVLLFASNVGIMGAGGDIYCIAMLSHEKMNSKVIDHPTKVGFYIYKEKLGEDKILEGDREEYD